MKILIFSFPILIFLSTRSTCLSENDLYQETPLSIHKRLSFGKDNEEEITRGKIKFEYDPQKGVHCKANKDLYKKEFSMFIPESHITCSADIFPFQFELHEALYAIAQRTSASVQDVNENSQICQIYLMAYHIMLLHYENSTDIYNEVSRLKMEYYNSKPSHYLLKYLDSLPRTLYNIHMCDKQEIKLLEMLGYSSEKLSMARDVFEQVIPIFKKTLSAASFKVVAPWISNWEMFRYANALIVSRMFRMHITDYEKIRNIKIEHGSYGKKRLKMLNQLSQQGIQTCLVPFFDLCNHRNPTDRTSRTVNYMARYTNGYVQIAFDSSYKKGEDYDYSYQAEASNEYLVMSYGFYLEENPFSSTSINILIYKEQFIKEKHDACMNVLKCFDVSFAGFYENQSMGNSVAVIPIVISMDEVSNRVMNLIRLNILSNSYFQEKSGEIIVRLKEEQWIDYANEMQAFAFYRGLLKKNMEEYPVSYEDIVYSIHNTMVYYGMEKGALNKRERNMLKYKYEQRKILMMLGKEKKRIIYHNIYRAQKSIQALQQDQFKKLRLFYESAQ